MRRLADDGLLREGLARKDAEHVLWTLTSFESFDALFTGRKMTTGRTVALLIEMAERAVYPQSKDA
jgi:hypothetical protein